MKRNASIGTGGSCRPPSWAVQWVGAQRDVVQGDLSGHADLAQLTKLPHLYAIGPLEGARGEVTIFGGEVSIARLERGAVTVEGTDRHRACFLAYASVAHWKVQPIPDAVHTESELERYLPQAAGDAGIDPNLPFPFLIVGIPYSVGLHILNKTDRLPHNPERHEAVKARFSLSEIPGQIVGFYSKRHKGIFTPPNSPMHMHLRTFNGSLSGHVDHLRLCAATSLLLPEDRPALPA